MTRNWHTALSGMVAGLVLAASHGAAGPARAQAPAQSDLMAASATGPGMGAAGSAQRMVTMPDGTTAPIAVVDGDSVTVDGREWRLRGFDTPEIERASCEGERRVGLLAKRRLEAMLAAAREIRVQGGTERDRWRRPLGDLLLDGVNVREVLIAEEYARPYNGSRKKGWCSRDSRDDLVPGPLPAREQRKGT